MSSLELSVIPPGPYCYGRNDQGDRVLCPYWSSVPTAPEQEDGYCALLGRGDWEVKGLSLLWDQVKECGINLDNEND